MADSQIPAGEEKNKVRDDALGDLIKVQNILEFLGNVDPVRPLAEDSYSGLGYILAECVDLLNAPIRELGEVVHHG
jgi:hypothetical protein